MTNTSILEHPWLTFKAFVIHIYYLHQKPKNQSSRVNESLTKQGLSLYNHLFKTRLPFQINSLGNTTKKGVVDHCKRISEEDKTKHNMI